MTLSWKFPDCPPMATVTSLPITCAQTIVTASEIIVAGDKRQSGHRGELGCHGASKLRMRVEAGADGGTAESELAQAWKRRLDPRHAVADLAAPAAKLLAHANGQRVHEVRPAGLHYAIEL